MSIILIASAVVFLLIVGIVWVAIIEGRRADEKAWRTVSKNWQAKHPPDLLARAQREAKRRRERGL